MVCLHSRIKKDFPLLHFKFAAGISTYSGLAALIVKPADGADVCVYTVCVTLPLWLSEVMSGATPGVCLLIRMGVSKAIPN